jgi:hypothetical protein
VEKLLIAFVALTFLFVVLPFLIFGGAFWIARRCARRWQTVFWQAGVYGTGAGLGTLALYTVTHAPTADLSGLFVASPADGFRSRRPSFWPCGRLRSCTSHAGARPRKRRVVGISQLLVQRWAPTEVNTYPITSSLIDNPAVSDDMLRHIAELNPYVRAKALEALRRRESERAAGG